MSLSDSLYDVIMEGEELLQSMDEDKEREANDELDKDREPLKKVDDNYHVIYPLFGHKVN